MFIFCCMDQKKSVQFSRRCQIYRVVVFILSYAFVLLCANAGLADSPNTSTNKVVTFHYTPKYRLGEQLFTGISIENPELSCSACHLLGNQNPNTLQPRRLTFLPSKKIFGWRGLIYSSETGEIIHPEGIAHLMVWSHQYNFKCYWFDFPMTEYPGT